MLLAAAGYFSLQSKLHRDSEQQMRWFALEVKAIDPFLSSLDDLDQKELKKKLSEKLFGQDRASTNKGDGKIDVNAYEEITASFMSPLKEILKKQ